MRWGALVFLLATGLVACQSPAEPRSTDRATPSAEPSPTGPPGGLEMTCHGGAGPTVVLVPGLGVDQSAFATLADELPGSLQVCTTERAGVGASPALPADAPDPSAGSAADQLLEALRARDLTGPYVLLGWSYGGMVVQAFVARHPGEVAGVVLEDASVPGQFTEPFWRAQGIDWAEGGRSIDQRRTVRELRGLDFGDLPLVVLTQGEPTGEFRRNWFAHQDALAALSSNSLHVVATESGHEIHEDDLPLVVAAIREVVAAVEASGRLARCDDRFASLGGDCA